MHVFSFYLLFSEWQVIVLIVLIYYICSVFIFLLRSTWVIFSFGNDYNWNWRVSEGTCLSLEETTRPLFKVDEPVYTPANNVGELHCATCLPTSDTISLSNFSHPGGFVMASPDSSGLSVGSSNIVLEFHFDSLMGFFFVRSLVYFFVWLFEWFALNIVIPA